MGFLVNEQNILIRVPKDERELIKISDKVITGKISHISDGDSFVMEDNTRIRLFGIDAPELAQTCILTSDNQDKTSSDLINAQNNTANNTQTNNVNNNTQNNDTQGNILSDLIKQNIPDINKTSTETVKNTEEIKCGENAKNKLAELIKDQTISCIIKGKDSYGRMVGECYFEIQNRRNKKANKININKEMVLSGNVVAFVQISDKYVDDENKAKQENRGIWATTFDLPSVFRKKNSR